MAKKKGNNYVIDEANNIAKIELHRTKAENLWTTIDLEDLEKVRMVIHSLAGGLPRRKHNSVVLIGSPQSMPRR